MMWQSSPTGGLRARMGALGVYKAHQLVIGAFLRLFIQQYKAGGPQALHFGMYIGHFKSDVVQAFALFGNVLGNDSFGIGAFQQFYFVGPHLKKRGRYFFAGYFLCFVAGGIEQRFVYRYGRFQRADRNANVFYLIHHSKFRKGWHI